MKKQTMILYKYDWLGVVMSFPLLIHIDQRLDSILKSSADTSNEEENRQLFQRKILELWPVIGEAFPEIGAIYNTQLTPITLGILSSHEISRYRVAGTHIITIFYLNKEYGIKLEEESFVTGWNNYKCKDLSGLEEQIILCKRRLYLIEYVHRNKR